MVFMRSCKRTRLTAPFRAALLLLSLSTGLRAAETIGLTAPRFETVPPLANPLAAASALPGVGAPLSLAPALAPALALPGPALSFAAAPAAESAPMPKADAAGAAQPAALAAAQAADRVVAQEMRSLTQRRDAQAAQLEEPTEAPEARDRAASAYGQLLAAARGQGPSPVSQADIERARAMGTWMPGPEQIETQTNYECTLHACANHLRSVGVAVTAQEVGDIVAAHPDLGPAVRERVRQEGLNFSGQKAVFSAVGQAKNISWKFVPAARLFENIVQSGRGAVVSLLIGDFQHVLHVEGLIAKGGDWYVSMLDSNAGRRVFLPLADFAAMLRNGGMVADPAAPPAPSAPRRLASFGRNFRALETVEGLAAKQARADRKFVRKVLGDAGYRARVAAELRIPESRLVENVRRMAAELDASRPGQ
jgi:hypothetical protein